MPISSSLKARCALSLVLFAFPFFCNAQSLLRPGSCPHLLRYFKWNALKRVGPYGLRTSSGFENFRNVQPDLPSSEAADGGAPVAGVDFSETNVQVDGVDEPDVIKTDGRRVFVLSGRKFFVVDVLKGGAAGQKSATLMLPLFASQMLLEGDRVLAIANEFSGIFRGPFIDRTVIFPGASISYVVLYQISVAGPQPKLLSTLRIEGSYVSSREVSGVARIVIRSNLQPRFEFKSPDRPITNKSMTAATNFNKDLIRKTKISAWLPSFELTETVRCKGKTKKRACTKRTKGLLTACKKVFLPKNSFSGFGLLTVVTVPLKGRLFPGNSASIASDAEDVYATATSLYVTTTQYRFDFPFSSPRWGSTFKTTLHKFRLGPRGASYIASGQVTGSVLNQFSMHEFNGRFFVATTEGAFWWTLRDTSKSKVTSFIVKSRKLVQIGEVGNLGIGERIFAVRYIKDTAYVVTFRQIDPLYIIDLSNPKKLVVTGELKIPGFSSYLHPIAPGRLLGVGREATLEGRTTGAKVSLFDVSDVTKPKEVASWKLQGGFSNAEFDHRAFLYWAPEKIAVLPVSVFSSNAAERFTGSVVLEVGDFTLKERGRLTHKSVEIPSSSSAAISRNFILGRVYLWSLSSKILQVNDIKDLSVESSVGLLP